jgi:hypothetical protein
LGEGVFFLSGIRYRVPGGLIGVGEFGGVGLDLGAGLGGVGPGGGLIQHQAADLGFNGSYGWLWASEDDGDAVAAFRNGHGEEEGFVARAGFAVEAWEGVEVEADGGVGVKRRGGGGVANMGLAGLQAYFISAGFIG